jgi:probable nitrogen fixation protein
VTFLSDLVDQVRASDTYGRLDRLDDDKLLRPYLTEAQQPETEGCGIDPRAENRLRCFYQAVAAGIEKSTGAMTVAALDVNAEGFGQAILYAGRLLILAQPLREAGKFGFRDLGKLSDRGERLVERGAKTVARYPEAARDE